MSFSKTLIIGLQPKFLFGASHKQNNGSLYQGIGLNAWLVLKFTAVA
jgi:hypothetical protein